MPESPKKISAQRRGALESSPCDYTAVIEPPWNSQESTRVQTIFSIKCNLLCKILLGQSNYSLRNTKDKRVVSNLCIIVYIVERCKHVKSRATTVYFRLGRLRRVSTYVQQMWGIIGHVTVEAGNTVGTDGAPPQYLCILE
jgi:hypothetical protein